MLAEQEHLKASHGGRGYGHKMTLKHKGNQEYEGLSSDTKPLAADTAVNSMFVETDTHNEYINNGTDWVMYRGASKTETITNKLGWYATNGLGIGAFKQIISQAGTTNYCQSRDRRPNPFYHCGRRRIPGSP